MGAWYYADLGMCVVKTTVVRIYGQQRWCYSCPSGNLTYNVHDWNLKFPGYAVPIPANCPKPVTPTAPTPNPTSGGTPPASGSGGGVTTSGPSSGPPSSPITPGPAPKPPAEGCAPAASIVDHSTAASQSQFAGNGGQSHAEGFGHSDLDQMAQPLVTGMTPLPLYVSDGDKPQYTQPYKFHVEDEYGHQTVHSFHEGTGPGILCFHPPELIDYMLHGSGVNPDSRWPTNLSEVTVLLHNCERADSSTGDSSVTRLAFGNPLKGTVLPKDGVYFEHDADGSILSVRATGPVGTDVVAGHLRLDLALDVGQYSDSELGLVVDQRAGTLVWNTDDEEYQYWDGSAWVAFASGAGDVTAASNITDHRLVRGDGGAKGIQGSGITVDDSDNVSGMGTLGCGAITSSGSISRNGLIDDKGQCRVYRNTSAQAVSATTWTKIQFNAETFDTDGYFDSATNYRYLPTKAGKYTVRARLVTDIDGAEWTADPTGQAHGIAVYKNGAAVAYGNVGTDYSGHIALMVFDEVDMNGSTDYLEIYAYSTPGANVTNGSTDSYASFERVD